MESQKSRSFAVGAILGLLCAASPVHAQCPLDFGVAVPYGFADPWSVAVGEFNGDSRPDLVVANFAGDNVSVRRGNPDGSFQAAVNYSAGNGPHFVLVADFDADGTSDLATANFLSDNVSILLGNPDGTFRPKFDYGVGDGPVSIAVGDFNSDGTPDLAVANYASGNNVSLLMGTGNPNPNMFAIRVNRLVGASARSVAVGDFDADGAVDLAVANAGSSNVSILLAGSSEAFHYSLGISPNSVAAGDFNSDGIPDLAAVGNSASPNVSVRLGTGSGHPNMFLPARTYPTGTGAAWRSVAVSDFDSDGNPDLAVANGGSNNSVSILRGSVDGVFEASGEFAVGADSYSVATGDFNGDGRPDLAVANQASNDVSVLLNRTPTAGDLNCDCSVDLADLSGLLAGFGTASSATFVNGDVDRDGDVDLTDLATMLANFGTTCP